MNNVERKLTEDEERAIRNPIDSPIISVIKNTPRYKIRRAYNLIEVRANLMSHYIGEQKPWLSDAKWYLGQRLGREVEGIEFANEILDKGLNEDFRLYYSVKYRSNIRVPFRFKKIIPYLTTIEFFHKAKRAVRKNKIKI